MRRVHPANIQQFLENADYPCTKKSLMQKAQAAGAGEDILQTIEAMPEGSYESPTAIAKAIAQLP